MEKNALCRVAAAAVDYKVGVKTILDWLGNGAHPVMQIQAVHRAAVCCKCPMNQPVRWYEFLKLGVFKAIILQERVRTGALLTTRHDKNLGTCSACKCYLKLKVWVRLKHITDNQTEETKSKLHPGCWVLKESDNE